HAPIESGDVAKQMLDQTLGAIGIVSVITLFSSVLPGVGDVFAVFLGGLTTQLLGGVGQLLQKPWLARTRGELHRFMSPQLSWRAALEGSAPSWFLSASSLSTVTLCLTLAIIAMNQREISYASD